jgi:DNA primase
VLDGARGLGEALYGLVAEGRPTATPEQRAALRRRLEEVASGIQDRALAGEYRRALLDRFFQATRPAPRGAGRPGRRATPMTRPRPAITPERRRLAQAGALIAITLQHPWVLPEVEESLAGLDLGAGEAAQCRSAALAWLAGGHELDSAGLMDHLAKVGLGTFAATLLRDPTMPKGARADAQPAETLEAWWHFFAGLRGEKELLEDLRAAQDAAAQALREGRDGDARRYSVRQIRLGLAINALRRGEVEGADGEGEPAEAAAPTPQEAPP